MEASMTANQDVAEDLREWFRLEAGKLPADAEQAVLAALAHSNPEFACIKLFRLQTESKVPPSWDGRLKEFWDSAR
jgi:hypothetical protein